MRRILLEAGFPWGVDLRCRWRAGREMRAKLVLLLIHPAVGSPGSCSYGCEDLEVSTKSHRVPWDCWWA